MFKILRNQSGASLAEMLAGVAILGITIMATLAMQKTNLSVQRQNKVINTVQELKIRFENLIKDNNSWGFIKSHATTGSSRMNCFANSPQTPCTGFGGAFNVYDGSNQLFYQSLASATSDGNGFTETGAPCNTHQVAGNSDCPIGYVISWEPICTAPCINPAIEVTIQLYYRPSPGDDSAPSVNTAKYSSTLTRGAMAITKSFMVVDSPPLANQGAGTCPAGSTVTRAYIDVPSDGDPFSLIKGRTATTFSLGPGTYKCSISGFGFHVNGFTMKFVRIGPPDVILGSGTAFAPDWVQTATSFDTVFSITGNTDFRLDQTCQNNPPGGFANFALGMPASPYVGRNNFATVVCSLVD